MSNQKSDLVSLYKTYDCEVVQIVNKMLATNRKKVHLCVCVYRYCIALLSIEGLYSKCFYDKNLM